MRRGLAGTAAAVALLFVGSGCSIKRMAMGYVADALSSSGGVFATDNDPELVRDAVPFGLKTYESILAELPDHQALLLARGSGFTQYAFAFVQMDADYIDATDLAQARRLRTRAKKLYLRGRDYVLQALEVSYPGFREGLKKDLQKTVGHTGKEDVPYLYWAGASWAGALAAAKDDLDLIADLPLAGALVSRAIELDSGWNSGALHEFMISFEGGRSEAMGGSAARARQHYAKALELSCGKRVGVHLSLAEGVVLRE